MWKMSDFGPPPENELRAFVPVGRRFWGFVLWGFALQGFVRLPYVLWTGFEKKTEWIHLSPLEHAQKIIGYLKWEMHTHR